MSTKNMKNITVVKVNPYEIAKASDMEFGFKSILENLSIFTNRFFNFHKPVPVDEFNPGTSVNATIRERNIKDFIIGGGFVDAGKNLLRPLPIVAFSASGGLFMTNGLDVENRPIGIRIGEDFTTEGYRIESIFIGNAWTDENILGVEKDKKDPNWDEFASEWRASYRFSGTSTDTVFSEFKKRQMQAVRFFVYPGMVYTNKEDVRAADTSGLDAFKNRVKIAEVLVQCKLDSGNMPHIQPLKDGDIRFVTAVQYWEGELGNTVNPNDIDNYTKPTAVGEDNKWVQKAKVVTANTTGMTVEQAEAEREKAAQKTLENKAFRAEHYNYLWTAEQTRTYALGSIAEISERLYKIHKSDGTLKEAVVWNEHINLNSEDINSLRGELIPLGKPDAKSGMQDIKLPYNQKIESGKDIKNGLLKIAETFIKHTESTNEHGATSEAEPERIAIRDKNGIMRVKTPNKTDTYGVVNVDFLNTVYKSEIMFKLLTTKYITSQGEFNEWIKQKGNKAYTYVILEGSFSARTTIKLATIGTKEVIGWNGRANIDVHINLFSSDNGGIDGDNAGCVVRDVNLTVSGGKNHKVIGFEQCTCFNCSATVRGYSGGTGSPDYGNADINSGNNLGKGYPGGNGGNGCPAYGYYYCTVDNCAAYVTGGNGGGGGKGANGSRSAPVDYDSSGGGHGGRGGDAYSAYGCSFTGVGLTKQHLVGGTGGRGGNCGITMRGAWVGVPGYPGNGGNGGDTYCYKQYNYSYTTGAGGGTYVVEYTIDKITYTKKGSLGQSGKNYFL